MRTDIAVKVPDGCYARIAPRSGLALSHSVDVGAGVVDPDYRGNVGVLLLNFGAKPFRVSCGDRIAQLILERARVCEVVESKELDDTPRGEGGFGSTNLK